MMVAQCDKCGLRINAQCDDRYIIDTQGSIECTRCTEIRELREYLDEARAEIRTLKRQLKEKNLEGDKEQ
jgi:CMP-2-keto-3-deoxyoctulosonic acid synthetase